MASESNDKIAIPEHDENGFLVGVRFERRKKNPQTPTVSQSKPANKASKTGKKLDAIDGKLDSIDTSVNQTLDNTELILRNLSKSKKAANPVITINIPGTLSGNSSGVAKNSLPVLVNQSKRIISSTDLVKTQEKKLPSVKTPRVIKNIPNSDAVRKMNPQAAKAAGLKTPRKNPRVINATHPDYGLVRPVPRELLGGQRKRERDEKGRFVKSQKEQQEQTKLLKKILKKRGGSGSESNGIFSGLFKKIPGLGVLGAIAGIIPGVNILSGALGETGLARWGGKALTGIGSAGKKLGRAIGGGKGKTSANGKMGALGKLGRKLGKFGKIGGLLGMGLAALDVFGVENSNMDRADKNKQHVKNVAGLGGSLAGGWAGMQAGAAIGSVVPGYGTAIGGVIGGLAGAIGGTALVDYGMERLDKAIDPETSKKMLSSWDGFVSTAKEGMQKVYKTLPQPIQKLSNEAAATVKTAQKKVEETTKAVQTKVVQASKAVKETWDKSSVGQATNKAVASAGSFISNTIASMSKKHAKVGYHLGAKKLEKNVIDCSGWVDAVQQATIADINRNIGAGTISANKAKAMRLAAARGGAAGEVEFAMKQGAAMQDNQITEDKLKDGMVIGMAKENNGRYKNIGHIVTVFTDPKTGVKMISESATAEGKLKAGVRVRTVKEYLATEAERRKKNKNRHLYAGDPYAQERARIDKKDMTTQTAKGVATVTATALTPNSPKVLPSGMPNYAFRFGGGVDEHLHEASQRYKISEATLRGFALKEGGWTGKDSSTSAVGVGQFTKNTWNDLIKKFPQEAAAIGMNEINDSNKLKANDPRRNKRINTMAMALLISKEIDPALKRYGIPITDENRYLVYNIGSGVLPLLAGKNVSNSAKLEKSMRLNGKKANETQQQWLKRQGGSINTFKAKANVINNPSTKPAQQVQKAIQTKKEANTQAVQSKQVNIKPQDVAPSPPKPTNSARQLALAGYVSTQTENGSIAHIPTRQVSQPRIAHVVSGGTTG